MRKSFVLFIAFILLAVSVICYGQTSLMAERDQVQITEHVLHGDKSVVEGVTLQMKNHYENQLFWDTTYVLGEKNEISTDYAFYQEEQYYYSYWYYGSVSFQEDSVHNLDWMENQEDEALEGLELAVRELYDSIGPSERAEELFFVKDYEDYYSFSVEVTGDFDSEKNMDQFNFELYESALESDLLYAEEHIGKNYSYSEEAIAEMRKQLEWLETFQEFFKIPILETEVCTIAMEKDANGELLGWGVATVGSGSATGSIEIPESPYAGDSNGYDSFHFETRSAVSNGNAYFTFNTHSFNGAVVDTSLIPGGYGIYYFPYDASKNEIYPEKLQMVYALDPNTVLHDLTIDKKGENLLLFTEEEDGLYMSVIDIATMTLENQIVVSELGEDDTFYGIESYSLFDDYMVINTYGELVLITMDEDGNYKKEFDISKEKLEAYDMDETRYRQIGDADTIYDWDGEHLLLADYFYNINGYLGCNFYVGVVDAAGVQFFATYDSSLQSSISTDYDGFTVINYSHCRPVDDSPMTISW